MKNFLISLSSLAITLTMVLVTFLPLTPTFASDGVGDGSDGIGTGGSDGVAADRANFQSKTLINPLGSDSLMHLLEQILDVILVFAVPLIVVFIILAGFMYVMAQGNPGKVEKAHMALLYAVIGGVIILGAVVILEVISGTVDSFRR